MNARESVRRSFSRAAAGYDAAASFQRETAEWLLSGIAREVPAQRVADIGCGTGHGLGLLGARWPRAHCIAVDFAFDMTCRLSPELPRICGDAESLPLAMASVDVFWSNLTLQWCDPARFAAEAARVLRAGGRLAVSTLGPATFSVLRDAFAGVDRYRHTLDFQPPEAVAEAFLSAGLRITALESRRVTQHHADLGGLLGAIRRLGANRVTGGNRRGGLMGRHAWQRFVANYERRRGELGLPLDYETVRIYAEKP